MQKLLDVNYTGTYHAARAALPLFRRQQAGHLIIVSSIVGKRGVPYMGAYAATKFAQVGPRRVPARGARRDAAFTSASSSRCRPTPSSSR